MEHSGLTLLQQQVGNRAVQRMLAQRQAEEDEKAAKAPVEVGEIKIKKPEVEYYEVTGNSLMKRAIQQARERILAGADIATPLRDSGVIDPAITHMVAVGEKSGELEKMLKNISDNLETSTDIVIERLSAAVEPLIIIFMAAVVGVIAYATILPILEVSAGKL